MAVAEVNRGGSGKKKMKFVPSGYALIP